jgi:ATP-dependent Clp protease ATP-binding subunit ClpA
MGRLNRQLNSTQTGSEADKLDSNLRKRIVGQDEAIQQIISVYQTHLAGMSTPGRPIGNLLFLGPTGSGERKSLLEGTDLKYRARHLERASWTGTSAVQPG